MHWAVCLHKSSTATGRCIHAWETLVYLFQTGFPHCSKFHQCILPLFTLSHFTSELFTMRWTMTCSEMSLWSKSDPFRVITGWVGSGIFTRVQSSVSDRRRNIRQPVKHTSTNHFRMEPFISPTVSETFHLRLRGSRHSGAADQRQEMTVLKILTPKNSS